ncbi:hypothetical protein FD16_GL001796 [Paucilactobacillus suebicus DSM 5007 = KCTC 3549]|uniref:Uncharacterized protein n=1 Tax=Paucilactobacillus suebicus DSM 5007 = KCTC 3549 TaxID=1423807 RepID=A0A0R1W0L0_9LACO|nr:hypothetical protein FD16_GL001796 [Paucilactobacillus suebicus DSM 5007 = KCTC 3549]
MNFHMLWPGCLCIFIAANHYATIKAGLFTNQNARASRIFFHITPIPFNIYGPILHAKQQF